MYIDSHTHLASSANSYDSLDDIIKRAKEAGLVKVVDAGINVETSRAAIQLAKKYPDFVIPTVGIQPEVLVPGSDIYQETDISSSTSLRVNRWIKELKQIIAENRDVIKAIGECGLDSYQLTAYSQQLDAKQINETKKLQVELFKKQIELAKEFELPVVIHSRGAEQETLEIVSNELSAVSCRLLALFHCFTGIKEVAKQVFEAGHYMSFSGILTYKNAGNIREIFEIGWRKYREQILVESDAPLLMPRGIQQRTVKLTVNEPATIPVVVAKMAEIVGGDIEEVAKVTTGNAERFYEIS